jgi:hypothetical protein
MDTPPYFSTLYQIQAKKMSKQGFDSLLDKYLADKCTSEEKLMVEQWYELVGNDSQIPKSENEWFSLRRKMWQAIQEQNQDDTIMIPFWKTQVFRIGASNSHFRYISVSITNFIKIFVFYCKFIEIFLTLQMVIL